MGEADNPRPVWRRSVAAALVAWMALVVMTTLASARLMEVVPTGTAPLLIAAIYVLPPPALLGWSFLTMLREPMTGWLAPTVLLAFCGGFVPAFEPLIDASVQMNFRAHRPAYDAVVADARAGRLVGIADGRGRIVGSRDGVRFRYRAADPGMIDFIWVRDYGLRAGVRYDDTPCVTRPGRACIDPGEPLAKHYSYYARFF